MILSNRDTVIVEGMNYLVTYTGLSGDAYDVKVNDDSTKDIDITNAQLTDLKVKFESMYNTAYDQHVLDCTQRKATIDGLAAAGVPVAGLALQTIVAPPVLMFNQPYDQVDDAKEYAAFFAFSFVPINLSDTTAADVVDILRDSNYADLIDLNQDPADVMTDYNRAVTHYDRPVFKL